MPCIFSWIFQFRYKNDREQTIKHEHYDFKKITIYFLKTWISKI